MAMHLGKRLLAFRHAFRGIGILLKEPNARLHVVAAVAVVLLGVSLRIDSGDWALLLIAITIVLAAEAINTAVERVVDLASPQWSKLARDAKDLSAACVLISAIGAAAVGLVVFLPYL